jgi:hypothetical protein
MTRSVVLFAHVIGMLVLFNGLAIEWLSLESFRRATTPEHAASWIRAQDMLKRVYGIAFAALLVSGIYLARRVGYFEFAWLRLAFGLMVLMGLVGVIGGRVIRSRGVGIESLPRLASDPWLRASLIVRAVMGLAIVYLMIGKPRSAEALIVTAGAVTVGVTIALSSIAARRRPEQLSRVTGLIAAGVAGVLGLAATVAAQTPGDTATAAVPTFTPERIAASTAALVALIGAIIGGLALARSNGRIDAGTGQRGAVVALVMGLIGLVVGTLVVAAADGGLGTGNGIAGGIIAMVVGLIGTALGGLARSRSRRRV